MPKLFDKTKCMMFANNTVLYHSHSVTNNLYSEMQEALELMYGWCRDNQITLNNKKCEYIQFNYRKVFNQNISLKLGDVILNKVK